MLAPALIWLAAMLVLLLGEWWLIHKGRPTLSRFMRTTQLKFPLFPYLVGFAVGVLGAHFFWIWCP